MKPYLTCPLCHPKVLNAVTLESDLTAQQCPECHGIWLNMTQYVAWVRAHSDSPTFEETETISGTDDEKFKRCPEDDHALGRYKVGHGVDFTLDRCATCNGVWLNGGEWEALKHKGLHTQIHSVFTSAWQHAIREDEYRRTTEAFYTEKFGAERYTEIRRIKEWLNAQPEKSMLVAYLLAEDPYRLEYPTATIIES